ncbi:MAG: regulatory protein RecX [Anaerolineae bacterium]|nr:RecX family transcriptional regulator [Caldilineales bacterium]MCX7852240.1 RecX family transcriptional regulator [Caldilineales bacterium]MDW8270146.1 regulatory protein RecX [Anaerolineae bacterium]
MPGVITRLVARPHHPDRVEVHVDGRCAFVVADVEAARLCVGQILSEAELAGLRQRAAETRAFDHAVRLLSIRPRSRFEIESRLRSEGLGAAAIAAALARLERLGYLDDAAFARWWVENRTRFSPRSRQALQHELHQKGVARPLIEAALGDFDADEQALAAGRQRAARWANLTPAEFGRKMIAFLCRRGFDPDTARRTTARLWRELGADADPFPPD